jgi:polar amino acid transport system substrate-binding protein
MVSTLGRFTVAMGVFMLGAVSAAQADGLKERAERGDSIRIGFAAEPPFAYPGDGNTPLGFANAIALGVLEKMGYTDITPVVTDWGGMIPALIANRVDIVTGGMYILEERCANVAFSEPIGRFGDAFIVAKGNPKALNNYQDVAASGATLAVVAGHNTLPAARREGVVERNIMSVPGVTELLAAVTSGRADAGALPALSANRMAALNSDSIDVTDQADLPEWTLNWIGLGFRKSDDAFLQEFNAALNEYLGSPEMLQAVAEFEYVESNLPGDTASAWICENR